MRPTRVGSIDHGSDEDAAIVALALVERRVLDLGADDYIMKPFDGEVFLSRVNAVFRRLSAVAA